MRPMVVVEALPIGHTVAVFVVQALIWFTVGVLVAKWL